MGGPLGERQQSITVRDQSTRPDKKLLADRGQPRAVAAAGEQRPTYLRLQAMDLFGERRLAQVQDGGGASEVQFLGQRQKGADFRQFHSKKLWPR